MREMICTNEFPEKMSRCEKLARYRSRHDLTDHHTRRAPTMSDCASSARLTSFRSSTPRFFAPSSRNQRRLGHCGIAITLGVYAHALPAMQQDAAAKLGALLHGDG